jgi:hypothetical protein
VIIVVNNQVDKILIDISAILNMDVIALRAVGVASPECSFQGEAIFFNCLGDCFVAETAPRSDIMRIAVDIYKNTQDLVWL